MYWFNIDSLYINLRFTKWIEQNNVVIEEQNGFRRNRFCSEHVYSLYSVINKRKQQRKSMFVYFVDAKKAFDTMQRDCLWYKLIALGIDKKIRKAVQSFYENVNFAIR